MTHSNAIGNHHRIIPTARMVAYFRSFSDIPYAQEASKALGGEEAARQIFQDDFNLATKFAGPFIEARYKCVDRLIGAHKHVLELAVGTSFGRGLVISDDPESLYIGTDLPEMIGASKSFFKAIVDKKRPNYHLEPANVLSYDELNAAAKHLGSRRDVVIVNEGLWEYLAIDEQVVVMDNIRKLLELYGGKWLIPDISDLESEEQFNSSLGPEMRAAMPRILQRVSNCTGRDFYKNLVANSREAIGFFHRSGFMVNQYPMVDDLRCLTSIGRLWGDRERGFYETGLRLRRVWVMSLR